MKFIPGDLVILVSSHGKILDHLPPGLVLRGGFGYPRTAGAERHEKPEEIYEILYNGSVDRGVSRDWLMSIYDHPEIS